MVARRKNRNMRTIITAVASLVLAFSEIAAQEINGPTHDSLTGKVFEQILAFPQEKIHIQCDKPVYLAGEQIWLRAHVADAVLHIPKANQYVIAELINPLDSVVNRIKIRPDSGAFHGHINLDQALPEGDYTLRAWTENMLNPGADYYFMKKIRVEGPRSASVNTVVTLKQEKEERFTAGVYFTDIKTGHKILPEKLRMRVNRQPADMVKTDGDSVARFSMKLPAGTDRGVLYIETSKSREYISLPVPEDDYEVAFFPEGGYIPAGTECRVAFKALSSRGKPEAVTMKVIDSTGREMAASRTIHDGMGQFYITARPDSTYYAVCTNSRGTEKRFRLPPARSGIYTLSTGQSGDTLLVSVLKSADIGQKQELFLLLHTRGIIHYAKPWNPDFSAVSFDTESFPSGVLQIILFDSEMNPLSERLVFCTGNDQARTLIVADAQNYAKRSPVRASVHISGPDGKPRTGSFSVSVTDDSDLLPDSSVTILTTLLLTSELKGYINNPGFYFRKNNPLASAGLELLMMTNGWRRYDLPAVLTGKYSTMKYPPKTGMEITGSVRSLILGKPVKNTEVNAFSWGTGYIEMTRTDSLGRFAFSGIEFPDSTEFIIQALNRTGKPTVDLILENEIFPAAESIPGTPMAFSGETEDDARLSNYLTRADTRYTMENGMRTVYIEEVVITAKAPEKEKYSYSFYMPKVNQQSLSMLDYEKIEELHPATMTDVINQIPFTRVEGGKVIIDRMRFNLNEQLTAVLVLDDMIINDYHIDDIDPYSVERVAVLKGAQATLLGGAGAGGAIVITTKKGMTPYKELPKFNIKKIMPLGYLEPAEFYSPRYETAESREIGPPDLRTTIYWNPDVKVSTEGEAYFDFYAADNPTDYTLIIEGLTADGLIISGRSRISRK